MPRRAGKVATNRDALVRSMGWRGLAIQADPSLTDRCLWVRRNLRRGPVRTLDVGFGNAAVCLLARQLGNTVVGISISAAEVEAARRRSRLLGISDVDYYEGDVGRLPEMSDYLGDFDQIVCLEVIEHVIRDAELIHDLAALLKPGGQLLLSTPWKRHRGIARQVVSATENGGHVRVGYDEPELRRLMTRAGLSVSGVDTLTGVVSQQLAVLFWRICNYSVPLAWALTAPLRPLTVVDRRLTPAVHAMPLCIAVIATKAG